MGARSVDDTIGTLKHENLDMYGNDSSSKIIYSMNVDQVSHYTNLTVVLKLLM